MIAAVAPYYIQYNYFSELPTKPKISGIRAKRKSPIYVAMFMCNDDAAAFEIGLEWASSV